ncbi:MAG: hypothetical protein JWN40_4872 [Phycisphaerales bacterium]|nr:hypothetical protein [Phycisphaerales bacterium]
MSALKGIAKVASSYIDAWEPCTNDEQLRAWVEGFLFLKFPKAGICPGHVSPFAYLHHTYFEPAKDVVVWAPRGGGKTRLGAAATLLDLMHKPGISVRILGGSLDQSFHMWNHLLPDLMEIMKDRLEGKVGSRRVRFSNGSSVGVIAQSQRAVRGLRVQKLRCDEAEMFNGDVWQAAQLVTRTIDCDSEAFPLVSGVVEALSTCHEAGGMMEQIIEKAQANGVTVLKWCLMEVLEKCAEARVCATCPLLEECGGKAKTMCNGFMAIDDAIAMKRRVSKETWEAEMLCRRPSRKGCVFSTFSVERHVVERLSDVSGQVSVANGEKRAGLYLGIDFGFVNPFVCLWIRRDRVGRSYVIDEYVQAEVELDRHIAEIKSRVWHGPVRRVGCDPAGSARSEQTGASCVQRLRAAEFKVGTKGSLIQDGLEMIRAGLCSGTGEVSLFIHPRCRQLIQAMRSYRYGEGRAETPVKDGADHLVDALRYYFINRDGGEIEGAYY